MAHESKIQDTETHFIIDPNTRTITNSSAGNNIIVQHDHNSERFTFEIPRYVDGHDMSECTEVRVNYRNATSNGLNKTDGVYICDDLAISDGDASMVTFSWLLSSATTQYIGSLYFSVVFVCLDGVTIAYAWNTGIYKDVEIIESINNSEEVVADNADAIASLREELMSEIDEAVSNLPTGGIGAVSKTVTLSNSGWLTHATDGYIQEVAVEGVTADTAKCHVLYSVPSNGDANFAMEMEKEVSNCWVRLSEQKDGYVVFKSLNGKMPAINITFNILVVIV